MPPKSVRQRHVAHSLQIAREAKRMREAGEESSSTRTTAVDELEELVSSTDALDTDDEGKDPSFELESSILSDTDYVAENFCEDWVSHLSRDDCVSLSLFLCFQPSKHLEQGETRAVELAGVMVGKSDKTVREWRKQFFENDGTITACR